MTNRATKRAGPEAITRVLLTATMLATCYLDFFGYRSQGWSDPAIVPSLTTRLRGVADAPDQYRLGILWLAHAMSWHLHIAMTMSLAVLDGVCGLVAVMVLVQVLEHSEVYAHATLTARWFGAACFVLLVEWFLAWLLWLQKPETLPATMLVAVMLWLWQSAKISVAVRAFFIVLLSLLLATFRADVACLLNAGVLLYVLARRGKLSFPRAIAIGVSAIGMVIAAGIQLWLMHVAFPHAGYGNVKMLQLWPNLKHATRWPPFVLFLLPLVWMLVEVGRRRFAKDAAGLAFLAGALLYALLWVTIGKIDEVRIFIPFALSLTPLTVELAMSQLEQLSAPDDHSGEEADVDQNA
jgi:hypothetical protein